MAIDKRVTFNDHDEPVVTITVTGWHDAFRFSWALAHLQVEFCDVGRRIGGSLRRRLGAKRFKEMHQHFTGNQTLRWLRHDLEVYPTAEELQEILPTAALETRDDGELVIYTGWARSQDDPDGPLVDWCDQCDSGADLPADHSCAVCGRKAKVQLVSTGGML